MKRQAVRSIGSLLVAVAVVAIVALIGPRFLPRPSDVGIGGASPSPSAVAAETTPPAPTPTNPACFDPAAPSEPVVFTNPDGRPAADPFDDRPYIPAARELPTFAGIWVNQFRGQVHIALTCDIEGAIAMIGALVPSDVELHFQLVQYTYAELEAIRDRMFAERESLIAEGIYLSCGGVGERTNRVSICIDPLNDATVAEMRRRYGDPIDFEHAPMPEPEPSSWPTEPDVLVAVVRAADAEPMLTCGGPPFPASLFEDPAAPGVPDDMVADVIAVARFWRTEFPDLDRLEWRLAHRDAESAAFLAQRGESWIYLGLMRDEEGWAPAGVGDCTPTPVIGELGPAHWFLDPAHPAPGPEATELHILVTERECASGRPAFGRIAAPVVVYAPKSLTMVVSVRPLGGGQGCPSNPPTPATVILPEPLGDRTLLDGGRHPPAPPAGDD